MCTPMTYTMHSTLPPTPHPDTSHPCTPSVGQPVEWIVQGAQIVLSAATNAVGMAIGWN